MTHLRCGSCRRYMKFIEAIPQRLICESCNVTYSLPHNGVIRPYEVRMFGKYVCSCIRTYLFMLCRSFYIRM